MWKRFIPFCIGYIFLADRFEPKLISGSFYHNGTFHFLSAPPPMEGIFCAVKYGPVGICNFCLYRGGIAILVITDPRNPFFSQSLFKFKNRAVGIFNLQRGGVGISLLFIWELWEYLFFDLKRHQK